MKQQKIFTEQLNELSEEFVTLSGFSRFRLPKGVSIKSVRSSLDEPGVIDMMLKDKILTSLKPYKESYGKILKANKDEIAEKIFIALLSQTPKEEFSEIFDMMIVKNKERSKRMFEGYCLRDYLTNNEIINIGLKPYSVTMPSSSICAAYSEAVIKELAKEFIEDFRRVLFSAEPSKRLQSCIEKSFNEIDGGKHCIGCVVSFLIDDKIASMVKFLEIMENVKNGTIKCMK